MIKYFSVLFPPQFTYAPESHLTSQGHPTGSSRTGPTRKTVCPVLPESSVLSVQTHSAQTGYFSLSASVLCNSNIWSGLGGHKVSIQSCGYILVLVYDFTKHFPIEKKRKIITMHSTEDTLGSHLCDTNWHCWSWLNEPVDPPLYVLVCLWIFLS